MGERRGTKGLELWCRKMTEGYPGVKIDNMTTSWRNGLAFCAIIHHFRPDLIDFAKLNKDDVYHNNELAFRIAEHHLGIPALLEAEDMVEYTVPDRLSILTYLSQFYQAFGVPQGSSAARIAAKRPQSSPDRGIVSPTSTSPPSKVAFTGAGKIRREPCAKCSLPVFIAERLNVGKLLYHRTCFRCARCNSQLTLANYYETENTEFCCEICPDEEKLVSKATSEKSVLLRSMSDEEKTASLKTFSNEPDDYSSIFETALENIDDESLKKDFTLTREESSENTTARTQFFQSQIENLSDSGNEGEPPNLPTSLPPKLQKSEFNSSENTSSLKDSLVISSLQFYSGFPSSKLDTSVHMDSSESSVSYQYDKTSVELDKTHNVVTKDKPAAEADTSLVKARMRLFENKSTDSIQFRKSDVHKNSQNTNKVPLTSLKSPTTHHDIVNIPIPIVKLEDLENFDQLSKENTRNDINVEDNKKIIEIPYEDNFNSKNNNVSNKYNYNLVEVPIPPTEDKLIEEQNLTEVQKTVEKSTEFQSLPIKGISNEEIEKEFDDKKLDESIITISDSTEDSVITIDSSLENKSSQNEIAVDTSCMGFTTTSALSPDTVTETLSTTDYKTTYDITAHTESKLLETKIEDSSKVTESKKPEDDYPDVLNPFGNYEEEKEEETLKQTVTSLNPFGDEDEEEIMIKPVPSPRIRKKISPTDYQKEISDLVRPSSNNPFECDDDDDEFSKTETKPPMPATRKKRVTAPKINLDIYIERVSVNPFESDDEDAPVPKPRISKTSTEAPEPKPRETEELSLSTRRNFGSNSSISSGSVYGSARKRKPAPKPPLVKNENSESTVSSLTSSPSQSVQHSPRLTPKYRKTKKAPPPPTSASSIPVVFGRKSENANDLSSIVLSPITLGTESTLEIDSENIQTLENDIEQEKSVKDEMNRNRQSQNINLQNTSSSENSSTLSPPNKSTYGKWKRRKGQAPTRPIPQRRTIKCLPMAEIRRELEIIEIQQQGLEKQGVRLEQIIREKCEGTGLDSSNTDETLPIDVEDLILQLFELVNEKNELFRKQAELMYLRRQQRLEEEHADVEYQIRCLMLQPEANKTDSDKAREEELINRLVEIVERRNEIIECLEMDRVREAEEDDSINSHINMYTLKRDGEKIEPEKSKKEKKKHKKEKKSKHKSKEHKIDIDKDIDESESCGTLEKKKKKKFNLF